MPLPTSIHATVSPALIGKVSRLFNGSAEDVLHELFQNARRAGARSIAVERHDLSGHPSLIVRDDGHGIADPVTLLALGASDWSAPAAGEDPAGTGVFSLAGKRVEYRSRTPDGEGWRAVIQPGDWESGHAIAVERIDTPPGTEVRIDMPESWEATLDTVVARAARHHPLPISYQGVMLAHEDWLAGAVLVETWNGCRIGVFDDRAPHAMDPVLNFHGLTVTCRIPLPSEVDRNRSWSVRVDLGAAPDLQLVLPARKEVVQNAAIEALRLACEIAVFRAIAASGGHRLGYEAYARAKRLGVAIDEATPILGGWTPRLAEWGAVRDSAPRHRGQMIRMPDCPASLAQAAWRVLERHGGLEAPLVEEEAAFQGYRWYEALERVTEIGWRVWHDGQVHACGEDRPIDAFVPNGRVERISLDLELQRGGALRHLSIEADLAICPFDDGWSDLDAVRVVLAPGCSIPVPALVDLLEKACFTPSDDREADSWHTQQRRFRIAAEQFATALLVSEDAAILERVTGILNEQIRWLLLPGMRLSISIDRDRTAVELIAARDIEAHSAPAPD